MLLHHKVTIKNRW